MLKINWFAALLQSAVVVINLILQQYDQALSNLLFILTYILPTLWLTYQHKIRLASWVFLSALYIHGALVLHSQLPDQEDVHIELHFIVIGIFSIILLKGKTPLYASLFLSVNYLLVKKLASERLHAPLDISQLLTDVGVFFIFIYFGYTTKKTALQMQQSFIDKNRELSNLNKLKNNLFGIIGHDLRSPLAALKVQLTLLAEEQPATATPDARYARMRQLADKVYSTTDNLLSWSMIQRGGMHIRPVQFDLSEVVESERQLFTSEIQQKHLTVNSSYRPTPVTADEHQLQIVVRNLLQNALKFTPPGGYIHLNTYQHEGHSTLVIQDSGVGIAPDQLAPTTTPPTKAGTMGESGTGLGLYICREFVRLNKGQLHIESALGKGTTVTISFAG
ncbi:sensor histidine kinase [uncultured Fibrella sp.]|uniref:sensor histidine kinase n=1 Tax=uncultured Fibrella sp. TaxID=1284596 RepID=UPI0035CA6092